MTRQREEAFALRLGIPRANWLEIEVRLGAHYETIHASGVVADDPISGLVRLALLAVSKDDGDDVIGWWIEPAGFWLSANVSGSRARLDLVFTTSMFPGVSRHSHRTPERTIATCEVDRTALAATIWRATRASEAALRAAHEAREWTHELPERDLAALTRALIERGAVRER